MELLKVDKGALIKYSGPALTEQELTLIEEAQKALAKSYSNYSNFRVGAAALMDNGEIVSGANQENAVYPLGLCAERITMFSAVSQFPYASVTQLAVTTEQIDPIFPCGSCRQVISEYENKFESPIKLLVVGKNRVVVVASMQEILPFAFDSKTLGRL